MPYPPAIQQFVDSIGLLDRPERIQALIDLGKSFKPPARPQPYPEDQRVPGCESEVFTWCTLQNGRLKIEVAVENPQGLSAMALAALLEEGLEGQPPSAADSLDDDLVYALFGRELSMGKAMGLANTVRQIRAQAAKLT
ncbi:MAG: SufE family protein [Armatimonadetes bacterium]|nr:SufE family protein [Armatimonadota bacterium]